MYQSLITATVFILTLTLGTLSSATRTSQGWSRLLWVIIAAATCGVINFCIRNSRSKSLRFGLRILDLMSAGLILGVLLSGPGSFCGNSTAEELYWGRLAIIMFLAEVGMVVGTCGAIGGLIEDRRPGQI